VVTCIQRIAPVIKEGDLIILESTSPVGTTEKLADWLADLRPDLSFPQQVGERAQVNIAHCPERVLPGHVVQELVENDRIIGGMTSTCSDRAVELYKIIVHGECVITDSRTAEMAKLTENSFRDVNIAFANELSMICDRLDIDIWELIRMANRHPRVNILQPGAGVGGHCIAVDPWFIVSSAPDEAHLIRTARNTNDKKPAWVLEKVHAAIQSFMTANPQKTASEVKIAVYGLAFKPEIDDLRESPALGIAIKLSTEHGGPLMVVEPFIDTLPQSLEQALLVTYSKASEADIHVMLVDHSLFKHEPIPNGIKIDCRGVW
jgi:UDP-N-acetyl-D-mannosaminuronic acid dehydrogenase